MGFVGDARALLGERHFPRLYATRLTSQAADGIFQASLASAVFFNPEHRTDARQAAAGFVVLLLPYSVIGPFAGVLLDRWRRQRVLVWANLVRSAIVLGVAALVVTAGPTSPVFYGVALAAVSVNRFYLSALSASLPHVVPEQRLVMGNSVTTTSGTLIAIVGGGVGLAVRSLAGSGDVGSAVVALLAAGTYVASSVVASGMGRDLLGPDDPSALPLHTAVAVVARGLAAGARHLVQRRRAAYALAAIGAHRFFYGMSTLAALLLYRNYFDSDGIFRAGLFGLGQMFAMSAIGVVTAAVVTPEMTPRLGLQHWIVLLFGAASVVELTLGLPFTIPTMLVAAMLLGFVAQGSKICVDTILQEVVDDDFRGRVFSFYDTVFNLAFITAAVVAAFALPASGRSAGLVVTIAFGYAVSSAGYWLAVRGTPEPGRDEGGIGISHPAAAARGTTPLETTREA